MHGMCLVGTGVLMGIAGGAFALYGFGSIGGMIAHVVAGAALLLVGIGMLVHGAGMCGMCKSCGCCSEEDKCCGGKGADCCMGKGKEDCCGGKGADCCMKSKKG